MRYYILRVVVALLFVVGLPWQSVWAQGKAVESLSDQEQKAYSLYQQGRYQEACEIYMATNEALSQHHANRIVRGLSIFFLVDIIGILFFLYVEKRKAYRLLVDKSAQCANLPVVNTATITFDELGVAEGKDQQLLETLQRLFEVDKVYLDGDLTIEALASRMGTNRSVLSKLVNHHLGRSFPALLNQYRINEAVRLLTDRATRNYTIEAVAQECGYNNRQVFHAAFKKETGLTPTAFREVALSKD